MSLGPPAVFLARRAAFSAIFSARQRFIAFHSSANSPFTTCFALTESPYRVSSALGAELERPYACSGSRSEGSRDGGSFRVAPARSAGSVTWFSERNAAVSFAVTTSLTAASLFIATKSGPGRALGGSLCSTHFMVTSLAPSGSRARLIPNANPGGGGFANTRGLTCATDGRTARGGGGGRG